MNRRPREARREALRDVYSIPRPDSPLRTTVSIRSHADTACPMHHFDSDRAFFHYIVVVVDIILQQFKG